MSRVFDYITVNKVLPQGKDIICLLSYENEGDPLGRPSSIKKLTLHEQHAHQETLYTTNVTLTDVTISSSGTIWAVDIFGHLHSSKPNLSGTRLYDELAPQSHALDWSFQGVTDGTPVCIIGEDDDLWIATHEGELIHYDGQDFVTYPGMEMPIRLKEVNGCYFLMGYHRQLMQYTEGQWQTSVFDESVPTNTPINDLTILNGQLLAVSNIGLILSQQEEKVFSVMLRTPDIPWFGCDVLQESIYLAGGARGAYKLDQGTVVSIKNKGHMVAVTAICDEVMFLLASTSSAGFVRHTPLNKNRWLLVKA